jgi:hypothetical protein
MTTWEIETRDAPGGILEVLDADGVWRPVPNAAAQFIRSYAPKASGFGNYITDTTMTNEPGQGGAIVQMPADTLQVCLQALWSCGTIEDASSETIVMEILTAFLSSAPQVFVEEIWQGIEAGQCLQLSIEDYANRFADPPAALSEGPWRVCRNVGKLYT